MEENKNAKSFSSKKNITIIALAGVLALGIGGTAAGIGISNMPANRVSRYMGAAERYLSEMNYEQAIIEFQRILEIDPMNADAYLGMAEAYIALGDIDNAIETLRTGLEQTGDDRIREKLNELLLSLALEHGNTYLSEEKYSQAESEFADALDIDEKCIEAYLGKADSHIGENDVDKAIEVLQMGLDTTGDNGIKEKLDGLKLSEALKHGHEYLTAAKYQQAESEFSGALGIDEKCVEAYIGKADSHIGTEDIDKAIEVLQTGFDITGDSAIKEKLDALIEEQSKLKLSWSNVDRNVSYKKYGHYVKPDGDLWQLCDKIGTPVTDKKYKYIEDFCGTDKANYTIVTPEDGDRWQRFCIDKDCNVVFEFNASGYAIVDQPVPLIVSEYYSGYMNSTENLDIYMPDGKLVYHWKSGECLDGSGAPAYLDDPVFDFPNEIKAKYEKYDFDSIGTYLFSYSVSNSKLYLEFQQSIYAKNIRDYVREYAVVEVTMEDGILKLQRYDDYIDNENFKGSGGAVLYEDDDRRIYYQYDWGVKHRTGPYVCIMSDGNNRQTFFVHDFYSRVSGYPEELEYPLDDYNFLCRTTLINDKFMICQKPAEINETNVYTGAEKTAYAVFKINWEDFDSAEEYDYTDYSKWMEYNARHERVSEFYDGIYFTDDDIKSGYLLVKKDGKWGYISLETVEELAMYDDASNFSNGYAVVTNNGKGCIVDSEFNVVSDEFPCTSASTLGDGSFVVRTDDKILRLELGK